MLRVEITDDEIIAQLVDGCSISVPLLWSWRLTEATPAQRQHFEILGDGQGVHWPDIDEGIKRGGYVAWGSSHRPKQPGKQAA